MVFSKINPKIKYNENISIENDDIGHSSPLYIITLHNIRLVIVIGKQKYKMGELAYYPIYVVSNDKIKSQIGIFEINIEKALNILDEDGDADISKMNEPLLYEFVNEKFLEKINSNPEKYIEEEERETSEIEEEIKENFPNEEEDDYFKIKIPKKQNQEFNEMENNVFTFNEKISVKKLIEETEMDANEMKRDFNPEIASNWISKMLKNNNYEIVEVEAQGDCFFAVVRDAFKQIGQETTVKKLREVLSKELTEDVFREHFLLYENFEEEKKNIKKNLKELKHRNKYYIEKMKDEHFNNPEERNKIIEENKKMKQQYKDFYETLKNTENIQEEYVGYMKNIQNMEQFREYILTSNFWADSWAISTLENKLNMKMIILSEEAYLNGSLEQILLCGEQNKYIQSGFNPTHYIITTYSGNHYRLVSYKNKRIFSFSEIPYDVKILIVKKCLEKNSGIYYSIDDFRNFKRDLGIDPNEGEPADESDSNYEHLYDKDIVFTHTSTSLHKKPGKGNGEQIPVEKEKDFIVLSKIKNWRKIIDDLWDGCPFVIDNKRWISVENYVQGSKFKEGFPDFYASFSLDVENEYSKNPKKAMKMADLTAKISKKNRPENIKIDVTFNESEEREKALFAKFNQNKDCKNVLLETKNALIKRYLNDKPAEKNILLMKVRQQLQQKNI